MAACLTLLLLLGTALALLLKAGKADRELEKPGNLKEPHSQFVPPPTVFILFLITVGSVLVIAPEFVFLRDQFVDRMNTIFKFYYQAWWLLSMAAAFGVAVLLQNLPRRMELGLSHRADPSAVHGTGLPRPWGAYQDQ